MSAAFAEHEWCHRCGGENVSWAAPSPLWNRVMRGGSIDGDALFDDMVCIACFFTLAEEAGVAGDWRVSVNPEPPGMEMVTPTGRVWDPEAWLWRRATATELADEIDRLAWESKP